MAARDRDERRQSKTPSSSNVTTKGVSAKSKGHHSRKERNNSNASSNSSSSSSSKLSADEGSAANVEYFCGPCLDEVMCKREALLLSEKDIEELKRGPIIYK